MQGYRFYAAMPEARGSKSASKANPFFPWTVAALEERAAQGFKADIVAVHLGAFGRPLFTNGGYLEALAPAIEGCPTSYAVNGVSQTYLRKRCTRIPESLARQLAPELFTRLYV